MECGGKRSATPLWLVFVPYPSQDQPLKPKRRRASLAAALHMAVADRIRLSQTSVSPVAANVSRRISRPNRKLRLPTSAATLFQNTASLFLLYVFGFTIDVSPAPLSASTINQFEV